MLHLLQFSLKGLSPLAVEEGVEVERCRNAAAFAGLEGIAQCPQLGFAVFKQPQCGADDITGRSIATRGDLAVDEGAVMLIKTEGRVLTHEPTVPTIGTVLTTWADAGAVSNLDKLDDLSGRHSITIEHSASTQLLWSCRESKTHINPLNCINAERASMTRHGNIRLNRQMC